MNLLRTLTSVRNFLLQYNQCFKVTKVARVGEKKNNYVCVSKPEGKT